MRDYSESQLKSFSVAGIIFGIVPIAIYATWIYANTQTGGYPENVELFNSYFPQWLRGRWSTTYVSLVCCVLSITCCGVGLKLKSFKWRLANRTFVILAAVLLFMNLWSMM